MKPQDTPQSDEALSRVLRQWNVQAQLPPRFQEQVWRRIEQSESPAHAPAWLRLWQRLGAALARPSLAVSYVTVLLLAGLLAGFWQAHATRVQTGEEMGARYVQLVDPFQSPHH
ncbi:MAG TPA: hypothetical protein VMU04_08050 [Candidatus Acidoferrum sp.]|nr:hypothetical protein [Candidatus Acidoferrum sp.]